MSSNEIRYCIDNQEKIDEKLEKIIENLPQETSERFEKLFEDGNIEEVYNIINSISPNSNITLSSLKLLRFLEGVSMNIDKEVNMKLFQQQQEQSRHLDYEKEFGIYKAIANGNMEEVKARHKEYEDLL